jgi:hypothetical protein
MSSDARAPATSGPVATQPQDDTWVKSYTYLRTAMVGLLIGLAAAVFYQTFRQSKEGFDPLASVSAYYYTPAQAIFVGALIGLGACMIALKGTNIVEEVALNLGGMFAAVVAIVPTSRGEDYETAVEACKTAGPLLTEKASTGQDCPTVLALADATRANVDNNMTALLIVGLLGLVAAVLFARWDTRGLGPWFWWGFGTACVVWLAGAVVFEARTEWFIGHAHGLAAGGLLLCIIVVAVANALRHDETQPNALRDRGRQPGDASGLELTRDGLMAAGDAMIRKPHRFDRYAWLAWAMVVVAVAGIVLVINNAFALFWLEIVVALLFVVFWVVQTIEQLPLRAGVVVRGDA